jgi:hypothetical protein
MLALAVALAVIALHSHRWVAIGWLSSMVAFLVVTAFASSDLFLRVELGLVAGSAVALSVFSFALYERMKEMN